MGLYIYTLYISVGLLGYLRLGGAEELDNIWLTLFYPAYPFGTGGVCTSYGFGTGTVPTYVCTYVELVLESFESCL